MDKKIVLWMILLQIRRKIQLLLFYFIYQVSFILNDAKTEKKIALLLFYTSLIDIKFSLAKKIIRNYL